VKRLLFVVAIVVLTLLLVGCGNNAGDDVGSTSEVDGMKIEDITLGNGALAEPGKTIVVHYTGTLEDGTKFDSSVDRGTPFEFTLGAGQVIKGWDTGFDGMKVGGKRRLTIPPEMGYGSRAAGTIPPNSTLIFDVELLDVK